MIIRPATLLLFLVTALIAGCEYTPKGTMLFIVEGKKEFDQGFVEPAPQDGVTRSAPIRLKWIDTNTWITSSTLPAGKYRFTARTMQGGHYGREVDVVPKQVRYRMPAESAPLATPIPAFVISGTIQHHDPAVQNAQIAVLFVGRDATLRRTRATRGRWSTAAPAQGVYTVQVYTLGDSPLSSVPKQIRIKGNMDIGPIALK